MKKKKITQVFERAINVLTLNIKDNTYKDKT